MQTLLALQGSRKAGQSSRAEGNLSSFASADLKLGCR